MQVYDRSALRHYIKPLIDQFLHLHWEISGGGTDEVIVTIQALIEQEQNTRSNIKDFLARLMPHFPVGEVEAILNGFKGIHWTVDGKGTFTSLAN